MTSINQSMESGPRQTSSFSQCYSSTSCTGSIIAASSARDCCAGTDDGLSFSDAEGCHVCIGIIIIIIIASIAIISRKYERRCRDDSNKALSLVAVVVNDHM